MKKTEEIKKAADVLKRQIAELIEQFVDVNGPCEVYVSTHIQVIDINFGRSVTEHNVEVKIEI